MNKAIFIDRDGVISGPFIKDGKSISAKTFKEFRILSKVTKGLDLLKKKKYLLIIITNQPDISKKKINKNELTKMHNEIFSKTKIDDIYVCEHQESDNCNCRKPKIGLILKAKKKYNINLKKSFLIGDRSKDIESARRANIKSIYIERGYKEQKPKFQIITLKSFYKAVMFILNKNDQKTKN